MHPQPDAAAWATARLFAKWRPLVELYHAHAIKFYLFMLIKNLLFIIPRFELFAQLAWLDCVLPGRLLVGSRIPQASLYLGLFAWLYLIANKVLLDHLGINFTFFCLEFACHQHQQLKRLSWWPWALDSHHQQVIARRPMCLVPTKCPSAVQDSFTSKLDGSELVRRPARTPARMLAYGLIHLISLVTVIGAIVVLSVVVGRMLAPLLLTQRGFELTRENCVRFVTSRQTGSIGAPTGYEFIYESKLSNFRRANISTAHRALPWLLPYTDFVPINGYHLARITSDALEVLLTFVNMGVALWFGLYFVIGFSLDAFIYARHLNLRLAQTAARLTARDRRSTLVTSLTAVSHWQQVVRIHLVKPADRLAPNELTKLQGSICDYFDMIAYYNSFVSLSTLINILLWLVYTFQVFVRTLRVAHLETVSSLDGGVQFEFVALFSGATLVVIVKLVSTSCLNSEALKLYKAIVRVMVLEQGSELNRRRWIALLRHFQPDKLYCFTLFNHTDLSWLFCLKIFSWVISALVILMSL